VLGTGRVAVRAATAWNAGGDLPKLGTGHIWSVAIDPATPTTVLAGTDNGVYRSEDSGGTWVQAALGGKRVWTVGFDPRTVLAIAGLDHGGVQRSDDAGKTWQDISSGLAMGRSVRSLAFGVSLMAAGTDDGVAVSSDAKTWVSAGLRGYDVTGVAIAASTPKTVLVAGVDAAPVGAPAGFLFRNAGPGPTWETLNMGPPAAIVSSLSAGARPTTTQSRPLLATTNVGVYQSSDSGSDWSKVFPPTNSDNQSQTLTTSAYSPIAPNLLYAGDDAGGSKGGMLLRSVDAGLHFDTADTGLPPDARNITALAVAPANPPLVIAAINPPGKGGLIYAMTDTSAPPPDPTALPEPGAGAPAPVAALPTFTPVPTAAPAASGDTTGDTRLRRLVGWPLPLAIELFVLVVGGYAGVTWYQRRMDIEGPP
jgi:hypothetical protein